MSKTDQQPDSTPGAAAPDESGTFGYALGTVLWIEALVAVIAALTPGQPTTVRVLLGGYAVLLSVVAVLRCGELDGARWMSWVALGAVVVLHGARWIVPLGPRAPRLAETVLYALLCGGWVTLAYRERKTVPPREPLESRLVRAMEVVARSLGMLFLGGLMLLLVDAAVRLPMSGH